jgi:zinc D-Ala-D-Ala dipeptidase
LELKLIISPQSIIRAFPFPAGRGTPVIILLFLLLCSCEQIEERNVHRIRKHVVYAVKDTTSQTKKTPVADADTSYLEGLFRNYGLVDLQGMDSTIRVKLRYASRRNLLGIDFYDGLRRAWLTCELAIKVCNAQQYLKSVDSSYVLLILDAARPHHIQQMMWDSVNIRPEIKKSYLALPEATSLHNYGCAVDATIFDTRTGHALDMGSDYDFFSRLSRPDAEKEFLKSGLLTPEAHYNRKLLRWAMKAAGLNAIFSEWWHFSLCSRKEAAERFELIK